MRSFDLIHDLFSQYRETHPNSTIGLNDYSDSAEADGRDLIQFLDFARQLQLEQPVYEVAFKHLVHQFVLAGSRAELLASLGRRLQAATAGQGALVLIEGVSGIGKTSLVMAQEILAQERGAALIVGHCYEQGTTPFWIWQDVVRLVQKATATPHDSLPAPFGNGAVAQSIQHLTQILGDWLITCAAVQPLVVVLDDLHWGDSDFARGSQPARRPA